MTSRRPLSGNSRGEDPEQVPERSISTSIPPANSAAHLSDPVSQEYDELQRPTALVLGATGFLGRHVAVAMAGTHRVVRATRTVSQKQDDVYVDLLHRGSLTAAVEQCTPDVIVNCVALPDYGSDTVSVATRELVSAIGQGSSRRLIHLGSAAEYLVNTQAQTTYGVGKLAETHQLLAAAEQGEAQITVLRVFNPVGPGMPNKMLVPQLLSQALSQLPEHKIRSDQMKTNLGPYDQDEGAATRCRLTFTVDCERDARDFVHVQDVAEAIALVASCAAKKQIYDVGQGLSTSVLDILAMICIAVGCRIDDAQVTSTRAEQDFASTLVANVDAISGEFGWSPKRPLGEAIARAGEMFGA